MTRRQKPRRRRRSGLFWVGIGAAGFGLATAVLLFERRSVSADSQTQPAQTPPAQTPPALYVGSRECASCHAGEAAEWRASQHHDAMAEANGQTVLGDFDAATFSYAGITSTFFKRDGVFRVRTDGRDGSLAEFDIKYTFGVYPLQQYLIAFPDGRLQALSIAWDARPKQEGGQRWFHLYPTERVTHDDELHWTRPSQNWNYMCADCHSTGVQKNYDPAADRFKTSWAEINVSCEACHGAGSRHVEWAKARRSAGSALDDATKGLTARLDERHAVTWTIDVKSGNSTRSQPRTTEREIEVCAQCHSRRGQIAEGYQAGRPLMDHYRPALLTEPLYHADGQQRGEVYDWGSFLESRMHANGVTCSDCHNPHTGKPRLEGNALCSTCHLATKYDTTDHSHHTPASAGAACVACHMPPTTYMVVDPRHDHSLRVPRPAQSLALGLPNACNGCHTKRDAMWAAAQVKAWYGHEPQGYQRFAGAYSAASGSTADAQSQLRAIAADSTEAPIARASALARINASDSHALDTLTQSLRDPSGIVRFGALQSLANAPLEVRLPLAAPHLSDPLKALRIEAVSLLESVPADRMTPPVRIAFDRAAEEYVATQRYNADRPEARVSLGTFYGTRGDPRAEGELKAAIRLDPFFVGSYVNLADLYRTLGRDLDGDHILREGLAVLPTSAALHYARGLALIRLKRTDEALGELERANVLDSGNAGFAYAYGVALYSTGHTGAATATLERALAAHPADPNLRAALAGVTNARQP